MARTIPLLRYFGAASLGYFFATYEESAAKVGRRPPPPLANSFSDTIGNTPLLELRALSAATGCSILAKCEHMNPGLSVKDRAASAIIAAAEARGALVPRAQRDAAGAWRARGGGDTVVEATGGNTGVALSLLCAARGYKCVLTMPDYVSKEKIEAARALGAEVILCPAVPFSDQRNFYHVAKKRAEEPGCVHGNQFEDLVNMRAHFSGTGPELWEQAGRRVDAFVTSAGTGGTIAGVGGFLRTVAPSVKLFLADPAGSSLLRYVKEGALAPSPGSTTVEGIGIGRLTANFESCPMLDGALAVSDQEAVDMAHYLALREGVFVGPSAALNVAAAVKVARLLGPGKVVVTVLCDGGSRYASKTFNQVWLMENKLGVSPSVKQDRDHADFVGPATSVDFVRPQ
jgi:cysteine synthase A